jgi:hypothetical protein
MNVIGKLTLLVIFQLATEDVHKNTERYVTSHVCSAHNYDTNDGHIQVVYCTVRLLITLPALCRLPFCCNLSAEDE